MKLRVAYILLLLASVLSHTQTAFSQKRDVYEFAKDMPVYADSLIADMSYPLAWGNSDITDFNLWRDTARAKVLECMMTPPPRPAETTYKVLAEEQRDGYKAMKIEINLSKYYNVRAHLLVPNKKGKYAAINLLHDHGAHLFIGKEKMIRPIQEDSIVTKDSEEWTKLLYDGHYWGDDLAKEGYVVLSADAPMWGERGRKEGVNRQKYDVVAGNMMMYGRSLSAFICAGCSMGGYRAWMLAALSDKIKVGAAVCWMVTSDVQLTTRYGRGENGGFANCIPALRQYLDYPHIASLACPKPMIFINGTQDKLFPVPGVKKAFDIMRKTWKSQNAEDKIETILMEMPHGCPLDAQKAVLSFLKNNL